MRRAWLGKATRFAHLPAPASVVPSDSTAVTDLFPARFAGSTVAGNWLDRITVHGLGTPRSVVAGVHQGGIVVTDEGDFTLWIPRTDITNIRTGRGIAGDVAEPDGMVIITWTLGDTSIDTGLRITQNSHHEMFFTSATNLLATGVRNGEQQ